MINEQPVGSVPETSTPEAEEVLTAQPTAEDQASESVVEDDDNDQPEEALDGDGSEQEDEQPDDLGSDPDTVKVEYDGEEYEVPKRLKDAVMATKDYTAKTQSLAEERTRYEAERADFTQYMEATKAQSEQIGTLKAIDMELERYANLDWNQAYATDIASANNMDREARNLQSTRNQLVETIQLGETERQSVHHQNMVRTAERTDAKLAKEVTGWGAEMKSDLGQFAVDMGLPAAMVNNAVTYPEINLLRLAQIGYKTENQVKKRVKADGKKVVDIHPSKNLKPKRQSAPKTLSNVTDPNAYRELRMAQKRKQAKG